MKKPIANLLIGLGLLLAVMLSSASGRAACVVRKATTVPVRLVHGTIIVPLEINGQTANFILDTGAERSVVTPVAAGRLKLARDAWVGTTMTGVGGIQSLPNADPRSLSLGGVRLVRHTLTHDTSLTVGVLRTTGIGTVRIDGLLGRDYLSVFDVDLDLPARRVSLYRVDGCEGRFVPWSGPLVAIPVSIPAEQAIMVPVTVDGVRLRALLDSGASSSLIAAPGIYRLNLGPAALSHDPAQRISGLGPRVITVHRHRFAALTVGDQTIRDTVMWVEPVRLVPFADMILGADWLAGRRVWISFATKQLFVAEQPAETRPAQPAIR